MLRSLLPYVRQPFTCVVRQKWSQPNICGSVTSVSRQSVHTGAVNWGVGDKDAPHKRTYKKEDSPVVSADNVEVEEFRPGTLYPTKETAGILVDGVRFDELPIVHVKSTRNNTHVTLTNGHGVPLTRETGGSVGFRNAKKGTNIAAQTAAVALGEKSLARGVTKVRVSVKGVGPGRLPALKGLQMTGLTIVSVTDSTPLAFNGPRPRKQRRL